MTDSDPDVEELDRLLAEAGEQRAGVAAGDQVIAACREFERRLGPRRGEVRERLTGPLFDSAHPPGSLKRRRLADGVIFEVRCGSKIARDFLLAPDDEPDHVWEPQTTRLLLHLARGARHVLIGGAYIGDHAVLVARAIAAHGGVCHAFEPSSAAAELMRRNAALNGVENLLVDLRGLWHTDGARLLLVGEDALARPSPMADTTAGREVPTVTVESYARGAGIGSLDLLMLDLEGGEEAALQGALSFLAAPPGEAPAVVFEVHRSYCDWSAGLACTSVVRLLLDHGYTVFALRDFQSNVPMGSCAIELLPLDATYLKGPPHGFNMLALKGLELDRRVFRLVRDRSPKLLLHKAPELHHPTEWLRELPEWLRNGRARSIGWGKRFPETAGAAAPRWRGK